MSLLSSREKYKKKVFFFFNLLPVTTRIDGGHSHDRGTQDMRDLSSLKFSILYLNLFLRNTPDKIDFQKSLNDENFRPEVNFEQQLFTSDNEELTLKV